jgi:uncharacterized protein YdaU (DUF1376 family)
MNRPWMPLYVADYLADTAHLSAAESGAYLHIIMHYWLNDGLPDDDRKLARIARMSDRQWAAAKPTISEFFDEGWKHKRIDAELARASDISNKRRASAQQKHSKSTASAPANAEQLDTHARAGLPSPSQSQPQRKESEERGEPRAIALAFPFDPFWQLFPNKVGKRDAEKAFERVRKSGAVTIENLMAGLDRYIRKTDDRPWCNPATWLNQGRWDDQPATVESNGQQRSVLAAADRAIEHFGGTEAARAYVPGSEGPKPLSLDFGPSQAGVRLISKG